MDYPKENSRSLYDYSDKSAQHAGYAAIAYAVVNLFTGLLAWIQYFVYHRPGTGGVLNRDLPRSNTFNIRRFSRQLPLDLALS